MAKRCNNLNHNEKRKGKSSKASKTIILLFYYYEYHGIDHRSVLLIQDSSGSAGTDDLRHNRGSSHSENYLRQKRPQTVFMYRSQCEFSDYSSFGLFT